MLDEALAEASHRRHLETQQVRNELFTQVLYFGLGAFALAAAIYLGVMGEAWVAAALAAVPSGVILHAIRVRRSRRK